MAFADVIRTDAVFSRLLPLASRSTLDSVVILPTAVISNFLLSSFENRNDNDGENEVNGGDG